MSSSALTFRPKNMSDATAKQTPSLFLLINDGGLQGGKNVTLGVKITADTTGSFTNFTAEPRIMDPFARAKRSDIALPIPEDLTNAMQEYLTYDPESDEMSTLERFAGMESESATFDYASSTVFHNDRSPNVATVGTKASWGFFASDRSLRLDVRSERWPYEEFHIVSCLRTSMGDNAFIPDYLVYNKMKDRVQSHLSNNYLTARLHKSLYDALTARGATHTLTNSQDSDASYKSLKQVLDTHQKVLVDALTDWAGAAKDDWERCDQKERDSASGSTLYQEGLEIDISEVDTESIGLVKV